MAEKFAARFELPLNGLNDAVCVHTADGSLSVQQRYKSVKSVTRELYFHI